MQIICSWCERLISEKEPLRDKSVSHSICKDCYEEIKDEIIDMKSEKSKKKSYRKMRSDSNKN